MESTKLLIYYDVDILLIYYWHLGSMASPKNPLKKEPRGPFFMFTPREVDPTSLRKRMKGFTTISTGIPRPRWERGMGKVVCWCNQKRVFKRKRMNSQKKKSTFELLYNYVFVDSFYLTCTLSNTSLRCTVSLLILLGFSISDLHQYQYPVSSPKTKHTKSSSKRFLRFMVSGFRHLKVHPMHHG